MSELDDYLRRTRAYVSALALLQRSQPESVGYEEFRRKLDISLKLVLDTAERLLRGALAVAEAPREDLLPAAAGRGLMSAGEAERWAAYFACALPGKGGTVGDEQLVLLRALAVDAHSLDKALRGA